MSDHTNDQQQLDAHTASISHVIRILRAYLPVMALALAVVATGYVIAAAAIYILAPATRVTALSFRLEFEGADRGEYPNGIKFSGSEIVNTPVLLKTFKDNDLGRFTSFSDFSTSVFVLQSNPAAEALAREYQARLADPRLSAVDRERIQREYEMKLASVSKDQFSLQYVRKKKADAVPETVALKVVHDILKNWSDFVTNEQHVLEYRVHVLSPEVVASAGSGTNPVIDAIMLRDKVQRLRENVEALRALPAADVARSQEGLSLADLTLSLDDVVRYRLDPLINRVAASTLDDRTETVRFLEAQLAHDERILAFQTQRVAAIQHTVGLFTNPGQSGKAETATAPPPTRDRASDTEGLMPQLNDTFIDRIIEMTGRSADVEYRRRLAEEYRLESLKLAPMQLAVSYDRSMLDLLRGGSRQGGIDAPAASQAIAASRQEARNIALKIREIHKAVSRALNPSTELITVQAPYSRSERGVSIKRLGLYGFLAIALALPIIVILSLLHNHLKSEEDDERLEADSSAR
jgi:hypothetical protein